MVKIVLTALAGFALVASMSTSAFSLSSPPPPCFTKCKILVCPCPNPPFARHCVQCLRPPGTGFTSCTYEATPPCSGQCPQTCTFSGSCNC